MNAWEIRREAKIPMWQERIKACRSSGMTVREWCAANGVDRRTYYKWEAFCLSRATQTDTVNLSAPAERQAMIKVNPEMLPSATEVTGDYSTTAPAELVIHYGCVSMDISPRMPISRIAELVSALNCHV